MAVPGREARNRVRFSGVNGVDQYREAPPLR
jgi:hypothetical protein